MFKNMAVTTGLEPTISSVTDWRSNQLNHVTEIGNSVYSTKIQKFSKNNKFFRNQVILLTVPFLQQFLLQVGSHGAED